MFIVESIFVMLVMVLAFFLPGTGSRIFRAIETNFSVVARRRKLAVVLVGVTALTMRAALLPILPIPEPVTHDEFSHLLLADTLAHGKLANPAHLMWVHFETFHVIQKPTYASMYYPAQGVVLAAGQVLAGQPFWGVWLSAGIMCATLCWMLQGWFAPIWALLGGLLAVIRIASFSYWANSYWGGAVPAIGGALVLGALPRIKRGQNVRDSLLLGLGLAILACSRPYESLFFALPIAVSLLLWIFRRRGQSFRRTLSRVLLPIAAVSVITIAALGYYFWRVTGNPLRVPYEVSMQTYGLVYFPWQKLGPTPHYNHAELEAFYRGSPVLGQYEAARLHPIQLLLFKAGALWLFFLGPALSLPFAMLAVVLPYGMSFKDIARKTTFLLLVCAATGLAMALPIYVPEAHYAAPTTAAVYALLIIAMRSVRKWKWKGRATGLFVVRSVPVICIVLAGLRIGAPLMHLPLPDPFPHTWSWPASPLSGRGAILAQLDKMPGKHLVVVQYGDRHDPAGEWVYNAADIDSSTIVWARDMGADKNREILGYYTDRDVWLLQPDENPPKLSGYSRAPLAPANKPTNGVVSDTTSGSVFP